MAPGLQSGGGAAPDMGCAGTVQRYGNASSLSQSVQMRPDGAAAGAHEDIMKTGWRRPPAGARGS